MRWAVALLFCMALGVAAQEPPPTPESADEAPVTTTAAPERGAAAQASREPASRPAERFDPSEEISEDLSVSFPADI